MQELLSAIFKSAENNHGLTLQPAQVSTLANGIYELIRDNHLLATQLKELLYGDEEAEDGVIEAELVEEPDASVEEEEGVNEFVNEGGANPVY